MDDEDVPLERAAGAPRSRRAPAGGAHASPPGEGEATGVPPAGQEPGLSGAAWRKAMKAATSALHAGQRNGKGRYRKKDAAQRPAAGMIRVPPPRQPPGDSQ